MNGRRKPNIKMLFWLGKKQTNKPQPKRNKPGELLNIDRETNLQRYGTLARRQQERTVILQNHTLLLPSKTGFLKRHSQVTCDFRTFKSTQHAPNKKQAAIPAFWWSANILYKAGTNRGICCRLQLGGLATCPKSQTTAQPRKRHRNSTNFSPRKGFRIRSSSAHEISRAICCFLSLLTPAWPIRKPHCCPASLSPPRRYRGSFRRARPSPSLRLPRSMCPMCPGRVKRAPAGQLRAGHRVLAPLRPRGPGQPRCCRSAAGSFPFARH